MVRRRGLKGEFRVELGYRIQNIHLPVSSRGSFAIRDLRVDRRSGRFSGLLTAPGANPPVRLTIYGRVQKLVAVPVLTRRLRKGAVIRGADLEVRKIPRANLSQYTLLERTDIVGMAARYTLRPGVAIRKSDVRPPILVRRGELVTMEIRTPYILITVRGRALDSGARGETIRLRNTQSKKMLEAKIIGPGRVSVSASFAGRQAAR
jgi:flagella basal body P-ring formation protein FlgA